jgi:gas vesicle protein
MNLNIDDRLIYFGAGCGLGLALGALFAPQSGRETRHNLSNKVDDLTHKVQDKIHSSGIRETAGQKWQEAVQKGKNVASFGKQRFAESVEEGKRRFAESIEDDDLAQR